MNTLNTLSRRSRKFLGLCRDGVLVGGLYALPAQASDAVLTVGLGGRILFEAATNGAAVTSVQITRSPTIGTAVLKTGHRILYTHTGTRTGMDRFEYELHGADRRLETAAVTVNIEAGLRLPNTTVKMPAEPPPSTYRLVEAFPGVSFTRPTSLESPAGNARKLFVGEQSGRIYLIPDVTVPRPVKRLFLDISAKVLDDGNEQGLKGFAFHPHFASNGIFYVSYVYYAGDKSHPANANVRLAQYAILPGNPDRADESSEVLLINQRNEGVSAYGDQTKGNGGIHNINECNFGPDGYLYLGIGDEDRPTENAQRIDRELWSGILRLDVDKRAGNLEPNPHPSEGIPLDANGKARYSVPVDNPFVGATHFNGKPLADPSRIRTEFWAVGFRNPWQFHFDALTGELWVGDVGFWKQEEVDRVTKGANGGWNFLEGDYEWTKPPAGVTFLSPEWAYPWGVSGPFEGRAIVGGLVYRGASYPALVGKYLFADYVSGHLWSLTRTPNPGAPVVDRLTGQSGLVGLNLDPSNSDLLLLNYGNGQVQRLVADPGPSGSFPPTLSDTGVFADLADLRPNPGVVPYVPNLAFWSDHAVKSRFFVIQNAHDQFGYSRDGEWTFPSGTVWIKHFDLETVRGQPGSKKRIETRILVRNPGGAYGVAYRWNAEGTEAHLVSDAGDRFDLTIDDHGRNLTQTWQIPSRSQCLSCHTAQAGYVLSANTRQLNRTGVLGSAQGNFLSLLSLAGYLNGFDDAPNTLPRYVHSDETSYSLEARARSYLAVNCASCHRPGGTAPATWDARPHLSLAQTRLLASLALEPPGNLRDHLVVPGAASRSIVWNRIGMTNGYTRMPPLGSSVIDAAALRLLGEWIEQFLPNVPSQTFDQWRLDRFGDPDSPIGDPLADPDDDGARNVSEFLTHTNPLDPHEAFHPTLSVHEGLVTIRFSGLENRGIQIETSLSLTEGWRPWDVPGNDGIPRASTPHAFSAPVSDATRFFRLVVREY